MFRTSLGLVRNIIYTKQEPFFVLERKLHVKGNTCINTESVCAMVIYTRINKIKAKLKA